MWRLDARTAPGRQVQMEKRPILGFKSGFGSVATLFVCMYTRSLQCTYIIIIMVRQGSQRAVCMWE